MNLVKTLHQPDWISCNNINNRRNGCWVSRLLPPTPTPHTSHHKAVNLGETLTLLLRVSALWLTSNRSNAPRLQLAANKLMEISLYAYNDVGHYWNIKAAVWGLLPPPAGDERNYNHCQHLLMFCRWILWYLLCWINNKSFTVQSELSRAEKHLTSCLLQIHFIGLTLPIEFESFIFYVSL